MKCYYGSKTQSYPRTSSAGRGSRLIPGASPLWPAPSHPLSSASDISSQYFSCTDELAERCVMSFIPFFLTCSIADYRYSFAVCLFTSRYIMEITASQGPSSFLPLHGTPLPGQYHVCPATLHLGCFQYLAL